MSPAQADHDAVGEGSFDLVVVVLAGGHSRRFGSDKLDAPIEGAGLLDRCLRELPADAGVIVVGPPRTLSRRVRFVREDPPFSGPAAGLAAGLRVALTTPAAVMAVLPGDAPYGGRALAQLLEALDPTRHVAVGVDAEGVDQPLMLALDRLGAHAWLGAAGDGVGAAARAVLRLMTLPVARVALPADQVRDIDTTADLAFLTRDTTR